MRRIDELHLELPFYGSRRMMFELKKEGRGVNRKRVQRLNARDGHRGAGSAPRHEQSRAWTQEIYPYLLRGLAIAEPNHVWAADITYIPMARGFLYLVAIMDWASRAVSGLAAVEHDRRRLLRRGSGGGSASAWDAEDFQHRPGRAIHQRRVHRQTRSRGESRFRWTGAAASWTTFSSNGCGARSNMKKSI